MTQTGKTEREWAEMIADSYGVSEADWPAFANEITGRIAEVRTQEREACAKIAESMRDETVYAMNGGIAANSRQAIAAAIRTRKETL